MKPTITEEYRKMQQEMHQIPHYGVASLEFAPLIAELIKQSGAQSISDYGAGKKNLLVGLNNAGINPIYKPYDPAFPEYGTPQPADLVCCIDVLEHIEPELLDNVLADLASITHKVGFFTIHMTPAGKTLPDNRNAHLIQEQTSWWLPKICKYFDIVQLQMHNIGGRGFWMIVHPIAKST
jgi:hypothetical protein